MRLQALALLLLKLPPLLMAVLSTAIIHCRLAGGPGGLPEGNPVCS